MKNLAPFRVHGSLTLVFVFLIVSSFIAGMDSMGEERTIIVSSDGSRDFNTIQEALDNAIDGDTILVEEGTYTESIVVDKQITIIAGNGNGSTLIDGGGSGAVVSITVPNVIISGFEIGNSGEDEAGIAIHADDVEVNDNICSDNTIGILVNGSGARVVGNDCSNNSGTGIKVQSSSGAVLSRNICLMNKNFGIHVEESDNITLEENNCNVSNYGVYVRESDRMIIRNNVCDSNYDHGFFISSSDYSTISGNTGTNNVNGIFLSHSSNNLLSGNFNSGNQEGILLSNAPDNSLMNNICTDNQDGIHIEISERNFLRGNNCSNNAAAGIHMSDDASSNQLESNMITGNGERGVYIRSSSSHNILNNNTISHSKFGIRVVHDSKNNSARFNNIFGNSEFGIYVGAVDGTMNASHTWWGDETGPYHDADNPGAVGDNVTDHVEFSPWAERRINRNPIAVMHEAPDIKEKIEEGEKIRFSGEGEDDGEIVRYVWSSSIDGEIYNGTEPSFTTSNLSGGDHIISLRVQDDCGAWSESVTTTIKVEDKEDRGYFTVVLVVLVVVIIAMLAVYQFMVQSDSEDNKDKETAAGKSDESGNATAKDSPKIAEQPPKAKDADFGDEPKGE